jgi:hypothetical protein
MKYEAILTEVNKRAKAEQERYKFNKELAEKLITEHKEWRIMFLSIRMRKRSASVEECKQLLAEKFLREQG